MHDLTVFNSEEFGEVRTAMVNDEPWFVGKDVAIALGYSDTNQAIRSHVDDEDKLTRQFNGSGQSRNMIIINESGLYSLIMSSKLPSAKKFKHWVTAEVLPSIRKTGRYSIRTEKEDVEIGLMVLESASRTLRMNEASRALMYEKFCDTYKVPESFLPTYVDNGGRQLLSATELLKRNSYPISAQAFNKLMIANGLLEVRERPSANGKAKHFKALTEKGLQYGENQISPNNPRELQPLYYEESFRELFERVAC